MHAPLSIEDRMLISAWLDGEVSEAERAQVAVLLERPEAAAYLEQLRGVRLLVNRHGAMPAPAGMKSAVMTALAASSEQAPGGKVIALPAPNWRMPLIAMAAAVLVAIGMFFGPAVFRDQPLANPEVAIGHGRAKQRALHDSADATGSASLRDDSQAGEQDNPADLARDAAPDENHDKALGGGSAPFRGAPPEAERPKVAKLQDDPGKAKQGPAARGDTGSDDRDAEKLEERKPAPEVAEGASAKDSAKDSKETERKAFDAPAEDTRGESGRAERANESSPPPPSAQPVVPAPDHVVSLKTALGLAAQNDVLLVGALHGKATLSEAEDSTLEHVVVELDEADVAQLVAALERMAEQQEYGVVTLPPALERTGGIARNRNATARDTLPEDVRRRADGAPAAPGAGEQRRGPGRKVRLLVKLN